MGCFRFLGKLIALVLLLVFIIVLPITLWLFNIQRIAFSPITYERVLDSPRVYGEVLPSVLPAMMQRVEVTPDAPPEARRVAEMLAGLGESEWRDITELLAPGPWLQEQIEKNTTAAFAWLEQSQVVPEVGLDLTEIKRRVQGDEGRQTVQIIVSSWPPCDAAQLEQMQQSLEGGPESDIELPFCQPTGRLLAPLTEDIGDLVVYFADESPDTIPSQERIAALTPREKMSLLNLKFTLRVTQRVAFLIFLIPLILLALIEILAVESFKSLWRWYGWSLLLGGLLSLTPLALLPLALGQAVATATQAGPGGLPVVMGFADMLYRSFGQPVLIQGGMIAVGGIVMLILSVLARYPQAKKPRREVVPQPVAPPPPMVPPTADADTAVSERTRPVKE